jgi:hypothetical protein
MPAKILKCKDCRSEFVFNEGEQEFFSFHEWPDPVRCKNCRMKRGAKKEQKRPRSSERITLRDAARVLGNLLGKEQGIRG